MPTVVVLPVPLTPTISVTCGRDATAIGVSTAAKTRADFLLDQIAQARAVARLRLDRGDDPVGGGDADVGRDQQLLERVDRLDVDRRASAARARRRGGRSRRTARRSAAWCGRDPRGCGRRSPSHRDRILRSRSQSRPPRAAGAASARRAPCARRRGRRALRPSASRSAARRRSARRARARRRSCRTPSATIFMPARISASGRPRASSMPTWRLRLRLPVHVSTRSPRPLEPGERLAAAAGGAGQPRHLGQPARDQRRQRVVAEASPSTTPAAIAMMFFSAAPISTPTTSSLP